MMKVYWLLVLLFLCITCGAQRDCLKACGNKGGFCNRCQNGGACCRQGWNDPPECKNAYIPCVGYHCCSSIQAESNSNCWLPCEKKGGWCPAFCGVGKACCRKGWNDPPECRNAIIPVNAYHVCSVVPKTVDPNCEDVVASIDCLAKPDPFDYRRFDGRCNSLVHPLSGAAQTPLRRALSPDYIGHGIPRGGPGYATSLPPANEVSKAVFHAGIANRHINRVPLSVIFMTFGQFLDHDFALLAHDVPGHCTSKDCSNPNAFNYPCFPIKFSSGTSCTPFERSKHACLNTAKREQMNTITHHIDGSNIYGNSEAENNELRAFDGSGKMKVIRNNLLPIRKHSEHCQTKGGCSLAGDVRADENIALLSMHTLWVREHNRLATLLKQKYPTWNDDKLFHTTRKIVVGEYQNIVFNEFLPNIVGLGKYKGYNSDRLPELLNVFTTAAYRFGHSLVPDAFEIMDNNFNRLRKPVSLREAFFNRAFVSANGIENILFGCCGNETDSIDTFFATTLLNRLLVPPNKNDHVDLTALNIQRGRDHGIKTYGHWRSWCKLQPINNWEDLATVMPYEAAQKFKKLYQHPNDIDLFAAGIAEFHKIQYKNTQFTPFQVGPTFECIFREQFSRLRDGDRFFYKAPGVFTGSQVSSLERVTLARIVCDNLKGLTSIQPQVFAPGSSQLATRITCDRIPKLSLAAW